jgi:hypothetical protein
MSEQDEILAFSLDDLFSAPEVSFYYTVKPGALYAGEYPYWADKEQTLERLRILAGQGVGLIIDLTHEGEDSAYSDFLAEIGGIEYHKVTLSPVIAPTVNQMKDILDLIDGANAQGKAVFVHCNAGIDRTGSVIGCYLVRHGMSGQSALEALPNLRVGVRDEGVPCPHQAALRDFVAGWTVGQ